MYTPIRNFQSNQIVNSKSLLLYLLILCPEPIAFREATDKGNWREW